MTGFLGMIGLVLLGTFALGLVRVWRGPTPGDRMLSVLLSGTTGVALLLILSVVSGRTSTLDVALVLAVLAPVTAIAFTAARHRTPAGNTSHD